MKVSTKGRYGLRSMIDLAINSTEGHVALLYIAKRQNVSVNYLEQVFSTLRKAGLVKSVKGAQGGYILGDSPSRITIGRILRALEGSLSIVEESDSKTVMNNSLQDCIKINVWDKMTESLNQIVDSITLEDMVNEYKKMNGTADLMYYI
ncbi:MAG TPA: Rrf2 family transcriptional regulator [Clostridia bacterium]|nr:Rrf2 family transcriptional regulator [Clostridia bacterium]